MRSTHRVRTRAVSATTSTSSSVNRKFNLAPAARVLQRATTTSTLQRRSFVTPRAAAATAPSVPVRFQTLTTLQNRMSGSFSLALIRAIAAAECMGHAPSLLLSDQTLLTEGEQSLCSHTGLRFDWSPEDIKQKSLELQAAAEEAFSALASVKTPSWETVGAPLADIEHAMALRASNLGFLMHVSPDRAVRDASAAESVALEKLELKLMSRRDVYEVVRDVLAGDGAQVLSPLQRRFIEKVMDEFVRNGVAVDDPDARARLQELREELAQLETDFSKEIADVDDKLSFTREQLRGCEPEFLDGLKEAEGSASGGAEDGAAKEYIIDTSYPHVFAVLDDCEVEETRRKVYLMFSSRAQANSPRMDRAVEIRQECATILGFKSHVDYRASSRMAKNSENIQNFLADLRAKMKPGCAADIAALQELKQSHIKNELAELKSWDVRYYARVRKEKEYSLDMQALKSYFPLKLVTKGLLDVYQEILQVKFVQVPNPHVWHEDVSLYAVYDASGATPADDTIGHFFLDLYPREGKYGHAAVFGLVSRHEQQSGEHAGHLTKPYCAMVCNFPKPSAANPSPTLGHSDVVTFFHEFGHVMHGLLTASPLNRFSGTHVERDFVEAPSQMLENWAYELEVLNRLTDRPLPEDVCDRLKKSRLANIGYLTSRQLFFATFDFMLHSRPGGKVNSDEVQKLWAALTDEIIGLPVPEEIGNPAASFGHLMGGYDAGYYGYLWSEVYSHDMYSRFAESGSVLNPELGLQYRKHILAPGLTHDSATGLAAFLGREPSTDAFLHHLGLKPQTTA